jgi:hypothetical protein
VIRMSFLDKAKKKTEEEAKKAGAKTKEEAKKVADKVKKKL